MRAAGRVSMEKSLGLTYVAKSSIKVIRRSLAASLLRGFTSTATILTVTPSGCRVSGSSRSFVIGTLVFGWPLEIWFLVIGWRNFLLAASFSQLRIVFLLRPVRIFEGLGP